MKTLTTILAAVLIMLNISFPLPASQGEREASANEINYKLEVSNINYTSEKTLEFSIYLFSTSSDKSELAYALGQYFLEFNPKIANGGTLTYTIVSSTLPEAMRPRNPSVFESQLRLACNLISSGKNDLPVIPKEAPGLLVVTMKLETSADKFSSELLDLKWPDASSKFRTKIFSYIDNKLIEIMNSENITDILNKSEKGTQEITGLPTEYSLSQNYPNPFNPATKIKYELPFSNRVTIKIYDLTGREIVTLVNQDLEPGRYEAEFKASNLASGVYFYRIKAGDYVNTLRMVLIK